jgi:hypothetical protein
VVYNDGLKPLSCVPGAGSRLICSAPDGNQDHREKLTLQVIDQTHAGGPIKGFASTDPCDLSTDCRQPLIWKTNPPRLAENNQAKSGTSQTDLTQSKWNVSLLLVNVDGTENAKLGSGAFAFGGDIVCAGRKGAYCEVNFQVGRKDLGRVTDLMKFDVFDSANHPVPMRSASITNLLSNMKPLVATVSADNTLITGQNLVYDTLVVNSKKYPLDCLSTGASCTGSGSYGTAAGIEYVLAADAGLVFPLIQVNTAGANTPVVFNPPTKSADNAAAAVAPKPGPGGTPSKAADHLQLLMNPAFNLAANATINLAPGVGAQQY